MRRIEHVQGAVWAVVPVKAFATAKRRLAPVLGAVERRELAAAMCEDVLTALTHTPGISQVLVVAGDQDGASLATSLGARALVERESSGVNAAIDLAIPELVRHSCQAILVVPSDLPLLTPRSLRGALERLRSDRPQVVVAPAERDGGTNLLGWTPVPSFAPRFGANSFGEHWRYAAERGLERFVVEDPALARDVDCPADLDALLHVQRATRTHAVLERMGNKFSFSASMPVGAGQPVEASSP